MAPSTEYDTVEGIVRHLSDLAGLDALRKERQEAGYDRRERMNEFIVLGRFHLDTCGNFSICTFQHDFRDPVAWLPDSLPPAVSIRDLKSVLTKLVISSTGHSLPRPDQVCDECGEGWDLSNCHDAVPLRSDTRDFEFQHDLCNQLAAERKSTEWCRGIAAECGLAKMLLTPVPNEYWKDGPPWCLMRTPRGNIKFGWRKRVINVDWSDMVDRRVSGLSRGDRDHYDKKNEILKSFDASTLFPSDDVTRGPSYIHAYGDKKLVEYLVKLSEVFGIGNYKGGK